MTRPAHPVLLVNPRSGGGKAARYRIVDRCREMGVEPVVIGERPERDDLEALAEDAVDRGCDLLGMAGGDGSQALVASVAARRGVPLVVVPAGTRNHFARDLGVGTSVVSALSAFVEGADVTVDLAEVNGRVFVNNASMGAYAELVRSPRYRSAKVRTAVELLPRLVGPSAVPADLRYRLPSGQEATTAQVLLVSNNPYRLSSPGEGTGRPHLDRGVLGIVSVRVANRPEAGALIALDADRHTERFPGWQEWTATDLEVDSGAPVAVGVDGEALTLEPPLRFRSRPRALVVRTPPAGRLRRTAPRRDSVPSPFTALSRLAAGREG